MPMTLAPDLERLIEAKVRAGQFPDADAVVRAALMALSQQISLIGWNKETLDSAIQAGLDDLKSGRHSDGETVFRELEAALNEAIDTGRP